MSKLSALTAASVRCIMAPNPSDQLHLQQLQMHLCCRQQQERASRLGEPWEECGGIRLLHPERQSLRKQRADAEPVRLRHNGRSIARRSARHAFGLDRRASFQFAGRAVLPRSGARLYRGAHETHPARAGGDGAAAASPDPGGGAMGDARPSQQRESGFRDRPRLRPARIPAVPRLVRGQSGHLRRRPRSRAQAMGCGGPHHPSGQALLFRRCADHPEAGAEADPDLCRIVFQAFDRTGGAAQLRPDRCSLRRRNELRRPEAGCRTSITSPAQNTATSPAA